MIAQTGKNLLNAWIVSTAVLAATACGQAPQQKASAEPVVDLAANSSAPARITLRFDDKTMDVDSQKALEKFAAQVRSNPAACGDVMTQGITNMQDERYKPSQDQNYAAWKTIAAMLPTHGVGSIAVGPGLLKTGEQAPAYGTILVGCTNTLSR